MAIYMHIDGIDGGVSAKDYEDWIEIGGFDHQLIRPTKQVVAGDVRNRAPGNGRFAEMMIQKNIDQASCDLYTHCAQAEVIPEIKIHVTHQGKDETVSHIEYTLTNAIISMISKSVNQSGARETLTFNFTKFQERFIPYSAKHTATSPTSVGYDMENAVIM